MQPVTTDYPILLPNAEENDNVLLCSCSTPKVMIFIIQEIKKHTSTNILFFFKKLQTLSTHLHNRGLIHADNSSSINFHGNRETHMLKLNSKGNPLLHHQLNYITCRWNWNRSLQITLIRFYIPVLQRYVELNYH